ncbi:unnamed protein product [Nippostrongylus brasiliensis]|uniref:Endo/exonuclease/phosphatase domain-containing protein n=1 Tax=Nippostrongylus brasiliensis TaxID=27835 RepID=A0A0N4Y9Z1_NIPBR|nr:unnamed protein product [Nippostrongylus brasiliensis]
MLSECSSECVGALEHREVDLCDTLRQEAMPCKNSKNGNESSVRPRLTGRLMVKPCHRYMIESRQGNRVNARTSPGSGAQDPRPNPVDSKRGLPRNGRPRLKKLVRVGTLNVGTLSGKSRELADLMKRKNIHIMCLQETLWKEEKAKEIGDGVKLFYKGEDSRKSGVGIAVSESIKDSVSAVRRISDRIMSLRIETKEGCWTIISVYAPQTGCPEKDKDEFYVALDDVIRSVPDDDFLTIAGDLNGHVGTDRRGLERVHGGRGVGAKNEEGERILDLAVAHDLEICSTFFAKRERARR